jgi:circularin A/uberolysin family circular bacteriocin
MFNILALFGGLIGKAVAGWIVTAISWGAGVTTIISIVTSIPAIIATGGTAIVATIAWTSVIQTVKSLVKKGMRNAAIQL